MKIGKNTFSGASSVHNGNLADAIRGISQFLTKEAVAAVGDITDNSGGTSGGNTAAAVVVPPAFTTVSGSDCFPKTGGETALGTVKNGIAVLAEHIEAIKAVAPMTGFTDASGGTIAVSGTVAVVTVATTGVTGASGNGMGTGGIAIMKAIRDDLSTLIFETNKVAVACGKTAITDNTGGSPSTGETIEAISTDTGTASADGTALSAIQDTAGETFLGDCADVLATVAAKLDECTSDTNILMSVFASPMDNPAN